jgi:hypothetical protein
LVRCRKENCAPAQKEDALASRRANYSRRMSKADDIDKLAEEFLDLWQENIRLWAVDKELLPLSDLVALVSPDGNEGQDGG